MKTWASFACALATVAAAAAVAAVADGQPASTAARTIEVTAGDFKFEPAIIQVGEGERVVLKARVDTMRLVSRALAAGLDDQRIGGDAEVGGVARAHLRLHGAVVFGAEQHDARRQPLPEEANAVDGAPQRVVGQLALRHDPRPQHDDGIGPGQRGAGEAAVKRSRQRREGEEDEGGEAGGPDRPRRDAHDPTWMRAPCLPFA